MMYGDARDVYPFVVTESYKDTTDIKDGHHVKYRIGPSYGEGTIVGDVTEPSQILIRPDEGGPNISLKDLVSDLSPEEFLSMGIVKRSLGSSDFAVNVKGIVSWLCQLDVQSLVRNRHGDDAARIFMLLLKYRQLEEKLITEIALVNKKDTVKTLYNLLSDHYVHLQEIPRSNAKQQEKSKCLYCWSVPWPKVTRQILIAFYNAYANLLIRRENINKAISKTYEIDGVSRINLRKYLEAKDRIDVALFKLDDEIAMHRDF